MTHRFFVIVNLNNSLLMMIAIKNLINGSKFVFPKTYSITNARNKKIEKILSYFKSLKDEMKTKHILLSWLALNVIGYVNIRIIP